MSENNNQDYTSEGNENLSETKKNDEQLIHSYEEEIATLKKNQKNKRGILFHITTGIVGGIVAAAIVLLLISSNLIPMFDTNTMNQEPLKQDTETMSTDLTDDSKIGDTPIGEVSKAVVGVKNISQQNPWTDVQEGGTGSGIIYKQENNRSEEHTSELQSRFDLVCRLLLE